MRPVNASVTISRHKALRRAILARIRMMESYMQDAEINMEGLSQRYGDAIAQLLVTEIAKADARQTPFVLRRYSQRSRPVRAWWERV